MIGKFKLLVIVIVHHHFIQVMDQWIFQPVVTNMLKYYAEKVLQSVYTKAGQYTMQVYAL